MTFSGLKTIENIVKNVKSVVANSINLSSPLAYQPRILPARLVRRFQRKKSYVYISADEVVIFNAKIMNEQGLLRDISGLESAIMRPQMAAFYEDADIVMQTVLLIDGIAMAHSFIDGNKRSAFIAGATFLRINGYRIKSADSTVGKRIEELVVTRDVKQFANWLRSDIRRL